jgi:hypothetical protein
MGVYAVYRADCDRCSAPCMNPMSGTAMEWSSSEMASHEVIREFDWEKIRSDTWDGSIICEPCGIKSRAMAAFIKSNPGVYGP